MDPRTALTTHADLEAYYRALPLNEIGWVQPYRQQLYNGLDRAVQHLYTHANGGSGSRLSKGRATVRECLAPCYAIIGREPESTRPVFLLDLVSGGFTLQAYPQRDARVALQLLPVITQALAGLSVKTYENPRDPAERLEAQANYEKRVGAIRDALAAVQAEIARDPQGAHALADEAAWKATRPVYAARMEPDEIDFS